jgi:N-methylhydantoinase A
MDVFIGADIGGTHTDVQVALGARTARGKALTTYDDFSRGALEAIAVAARGLDLTLEELLSRTTRLVNATTVVTNAITEMDGSRVGVLVTAGFRDTFRIGGGPRRPTFDDHLQRNMPDLTDRRDIVEIDERVDFRGVAIVPLREAEVERAARYLVDERCVEAVAICFLSSHVNPAHELEAEGVIRRLYPSIFVTLSHRMSARQGETRRWTTALLNSFVHARAHTYLESLTLALRNAGLGRDPIFFQGLGGALSKERARQVPLALLGSGPAAGAIAARELARRMGKRHCLLGDMGGTSFDTGVIHDGRIRIERQLELGPLRTALNLVDVVSIGAGGGSIISVSDRGVPQVGPRSAGSTPGPACYGRGGTEATVTDAMVAMGHIDPDNYLGGRVSIRREYAIEALRTAVADRFGWSAEAAAAAAYDLVVANMANAIRRVTIQRGYHPRDFVFVAYGGSLPLFAWDTAVAIGMDEVVIPENSSVFCAKGVLESDFVLRRDQTVAWNLADAPDLARVNELGDRLVEASLHELAQDGFRRDEITISRQGDFRYIGQVYELTIPLPNRALTPEDKPDLQRAFVDLYETTYGAGTARGNAPVELFTYTVTATVADAGLPPAVRSELGAPGSAVSKGERTVFLPGSRRSADVPVYDDAKFMAGATVSGPALIDATDTTIFVPPGVIARRDEVMNYRLSAKGSE